MATRDTISSKLKLVVVYHDDAGETKERSTTFSNLKPDMAPEDVIAVGEALGSLDSGTFGDVYEITESLLKK